jgi:hypothetical protein
MTKPVTLHAAPSDSPGGVPMMPTFSAFARHRLVVRGDRETMLAATKKHLDRGGDPVLVFDDQTGRQIDFDFRGSVTEVVDRARGPAKSGPGRPKLGVISREVSLLPRHWDWLENQPNGISAAIRRLVDEARHHETGIERGRHVRSAVSRFMWGIAGDLPNFEEATRALFARDDQRLETLIAGWPADVRRHVLDKVAQAAAIEAW